MIATAVVFVVGIILIVGALLPRAHVVSRSVVLKQSPEVIWAIISDASAAAAWRPDVQQVEMLPAEKGRERYRP